MDKFLKNLEQLNNIMKFADNPNANNAESDEEGLGFENLEYFHSDDNTKMDLFNNEVENLDASIPDSQPELPQPVNYIDDETLMQQAIEMSLLEEQAKRIQQPHQAHYNRNSFKAGDRSNDNRRNRSRNMDQPNIYNFMTGNILRPTTNFKFPTMPISELPPAYYAKYYSNNSTDKIIIPNSIMENLYAHPSMSSENDIVIMEIKTNRSDKVKFATIGDFINGNTCYLPDLIFYGMELDLNTVCHYSVVNNVKKVKKVVLEPEQYEFLHVKDQNDLLLNEFNKNFRILTKGQQLIVKQSNISELTFNVISLFDDKDKELNMGIICDVDLEVEFNIKDEHATKYQEEKIAEKRKEEEEKRKAEMEIQKEVMNNIKQSMRFKRPDEIGTSNDKTIFYKPPERFEGEGHALGGETTSIKSSKELSKEELRKKRLARFNK